MAAIREVLTPRAVDDLLQSAQHLTASRGLSTPEPDHAWVNTTTTVERGHRRYDLRITSDEDRFAPLSAAPLLRAMLKSLLGAHRAELFRGVILTHPGATNQPIHRDGAPLFPETALCERTPPYCLNLFVPLGPFDPAAGTTMLLPDSHDAAAPGVAPTDFTAFEPNPGDVLIFDYRLLHFGSANNSQHSRHVYYETHARPWFTDTDNFYTIDEERK